jgi:Membrane protease subunits, stomatin/prohibitin homologs
MGQLFQLILDNLHKLWPYRVVDADCQGIRLYRGGMTLLQPGGHWFCPGLQKVEEWTVVYQNIDCGDQRLTTKDNTKVTLSCNLGYRVADLVKMRMQFQHFDTSLRNVARGIVYEVVTTHTYAELVADPAMIQKALVKGCRKELEGTGVRVLDAKLDQFVETRMYSIFNAPSSALPF